MPPESLNIITIVLLVIVLFLIWRASRSENAGGESGKNAEAILEQLRLAQSSTELLIKGLREDNVDIRKALSDQAKDLLVLVGDRQDQLKESLGVRFTNLEDRVRTTIAAASKDETEANEKLRTTLESKFESASVEMRGTLSQELKEVREAVQRFDEQFGQRMASLLKELAAHQDAQRRMLVEQFGGFKEVLKEVQQGLDKSGLSVVETIRDFQEQVIKSLKDFVEVQKNEMFRLRKDMSESSQRTRESLAQEIGQIREQNDKKLEQMRQTVEEKLQNTLEARLTTSFKQVSDLLEQVHQGLRQMQTLATGVGDLNKVLSNVKTRGTWGEVQLGALLDEMLAPDQYAQNVAPKGAGERVEYAVKLPGRDGGGGGAPVWLPIDAKFPTEDYQRLVEASARADAAGVENAARELEASLRRSARTINEKYISPPDTTDFGILFLPAEGLYAEAMRRPGLAESIRREHRVILSGPSTLAALLNSLQMGFRTLAIQKRSSEVWALLGAIKLEFGKYGDVLVKIKRKLGEAQNTIDQAETRTRVIQRKLKAVETVEGAPALPADLAEGIGDQDSDEGATLVDAAGGA